MSLSNSHHEQQSVPVRPYRVEQMLERHLVEVVELEEITGLNRWGYEAYRRELHRNPNSIMIVATSLAPHTDREVVGFFAGWTVEDELHVNNIASHPEYRMIGIGHSLMQAAIEEARLRGIAYVLLEVRASNEVAQSLYRKLGFSYMGRRRDYYRGPVEDAFVMKLDIG